MKTSQAQLTLCCSIVFCGVVGLCVLQVGNGFPDRRNIRLQMPNERGITVNRTLSHNVHNRLCEPSNDTVGILYHKVPKSGSSTTWHLFSSVGRDTHRYAHLKHNVCHHCSNFRGQLSRSLDMVKNLLENGKFVFSCHMYYIHNYRWENSSAKVRHVSLVRHPFAQKKSYFTYFWPRMTGRESDPCGCFNMTFDQCVVSSPHECADKVLSVENSTIQYFCGYEEICRTNPNSLKAYSIAKRNLQEFRFIGVLEYYLSSLQLLEILEPMLAGITKSFVSGGGNTYKFSDVAGSQISLEAFNKLMEFNRDNYNYLLYQDILHIFRMRHSECLMRSSLSKDMTIEAVNEVVRSLGYI